MIVVTWLPVELEPTAPAPQVTTSCRFVKCRHFGQSGRFYRTSRLRYIARIFLRVDKTRFVLLQDYRSDFNRRICKGSKTSRGAISQVCQCGHFYRSGRVRSDAGKYVRVCNHRSIRQPSYNCLTRYFFYMEKLIKGHDVRFYVTRAIFNS